MLFWICIGVSAVVICAAVVFVWSDFRAKAKLPPHEVRRVYRVTDE